MMGKRTTSVFATILAGVLLPLCVNGAINPKKLVEPVPLRAGNVFPQGAELAFEGQKDIPAVLNYIVYDWQDNKVASGRWNCKRVSKLVLKPLPRGYYRLAFVRGNGDAYEEIRFAIVSDPETRDFNPNSPYALDSAQSWLASYNPRGGENSNKEAAELARLLGVSMVRDRFSWSETFDASNPEKELQDYNDFGRYVDAIDYLGEYNIPILQVFHDSPAQLRSHMRSIPDDLREVYNFCYKIGNRYDKTITAWEFWNEENSADFCLDPCWDYTAAQKAAYLGFKAANPDLKVIMGGLTGYPLPPDFYTDLMMANGIADYMDAYNYHEYSGLHEYDLLSGSAFKYLEKYNASHLPIWVTESGSKREGVSTVDPIVGNYREQDLEQERLLAEFIVKSNVFLQMYGVEKIFPFVLLPYNEMGGNKQWGFFRWDYMPKMIFSAYANQIELLQNATLLGKVETEDAISAYLFRQKDGRQTLVFWANDKGFESYTDIFTPQTLHEYNKQDTRRYFAVKGDINEDSTVIDLMGGDGEKISRIENTISLVATRYPQYLLNVENITVKELPRVASEKKERAGLFDKNIVLQAVVPTPKDVIYRDTYEIKKGEKIPIRVYNFGAETVTGRLVSQSRYDIRGLNRTLTIEPFGCQTVEIEIASLGSGSLHEIVKLTGRFNGKDISPLTMLLFFTEEAAKEGGKSFDIGNINRWSNPDPSTIKIEEGKQPGTMVFTLNVGPNDNYSNFPTFEFLPGENINGADLASFDIRVKATEPAENFEWFILNTADEKDVANNFVFSLPGDKWQTLHLNLFTKPYFVPENVRRIRFGAKCKVPTTVTIEVRNLRFHCSPPGSGEIY